MNIDGSRSVQTDGKSPRQTDLSFGDANGCRTSILIVVRLSQIWALLEWSLKRMLIFWRKTTKETDERRSSHRHVPCRQIGSSTTTTRDTHQSIICSVSNHADWYVRKSTAVQADSPQSIFVLQAKENLRLSLLKIGTKASDERSLDYQSFSPSVIRLEDDRSKR